MITTIRFTIATFIVLLLSACAAATPYQADGGFWGNGLGGYKDKKLADKRYWIRFIGNGFTELNTVENYWHRRATELCNSAQFKADMKSGYQSSTDYGYAAGVVYASDHNYPYAEGTVTCD